MAHAVVGAGKTVRVRGTGQAGNIGVAYVVMSLVGQIFFTAVDVGVREALLSVELFEVVDVLLLLPGQHRELLLEKVDGVKQLDGNVGEDWRWNFWWRCSNIDTLRIVQL